MNDGQTFRDARIVICIMRALGLVLSLLLALPSLARVDARVAVPVAIGDDLRTTWRVVVTNSADVAVEDFRFLFWVLPDAVVGMPEGCVPESGNPLEARCTADLAPNSSRTFEFIAQHRTRNGIFSGGVAGAALLDYNQAVFGRTFTVTSTSDSGAGSLRQAIEDANRECASFAEPCVIAFRIDGPVPPEGWFTIRPRSPLPAVTTYYLGIDGGTQSRHTGETNPSGGPEIFLDGSEAGSSHGLVVSSTAVSDLAIGNFTGNGIESSFGGQFRRNYLGVDPTGRAAAPNGLRGLQVNGGGARVVDNVLSGNLRSGAFFWTIDAIDAYGNRVGVAADGVTPLGNGASGFFFHRPQLHYRVSDVHGNVIGYNAHAGIGVSLGANGLFADNTFLGSAERAIDVGMDGVTPETRMGLPGQGGRMGAPRITGASWNGSETVIDVHIAPAPASVRFYERVYVYASASPAEAGEVVAIADARLATLSLRVPEDLRGRFVRASAVGAFAYNWDEPAVGTSELSAPRRVE